MSAQFPLTPTNPAFSLVPPHWKTRPELTACASTAYTSTGPAYGPIRSRELTRDPPTCPYATMTPPGSSGSFRSTPEIHPANQIMPPRWVDNCLKDLHAGLKEGEALTDVNKRVRSAYRENSVFRMSCGVVDPLWERLYVGTRREKVKGLFSKLGVRVSREDDSSFTRKFFNTFIVHCYFYNGSKRNLSLRALRNLEGAPNLGDEYLCSSSWADTLRKLRGEGQCAVEIFGEFLSAADRGIAWDDRLKSYLQENASQ